MHVPKHMLSSIIETMLLHKIMQRLNDAPFVQTLVLGGGKQHGPLKNAAHSSTQKKGGKRKNKKLEINTQKCSCV